MSVISRDRIASTYDSKADLAYNHSVSYRASVQYLYSHQMVKVDDG
jgi:hypothetical protein